MNKKIKLLIKNVMEKVFKNLRELMEADLEFEASKSNYITVVTEPKVRKGQNFDKWRVVARPKDLTQPMIMMEITPRWLTITVHQGETQMSRRIDINRFKKDPKTITKGIFEF